MTGQDLKEIRKQSGLNQTKVAIKAGTTQNTISRVERDEAKFVQEALAILKAYGLKLVREDA